jgi:hypothetical protein
MATSIRLSNESLVLKAYASLIGAAPGSNAFNEHNAFIAANGANAYVSALNSVFASVSNTDLAAAIRSNLGLTSVVDQATTEAFLAANAANRVGAIFAIADVLATTSDASLAAAKAAYNAGIDAAYDYSVVATNYVGTSIATLTAVSTTFTLTTGFDNLTGTSGADLFNAYILNNSNTLQSGDIIKGGAGVDKLFADIGNSQAFAITAQTDSVEVVSIRAQAVPNDATNGNNTGSGAFVNMVQIDAQRMSGVNQWESNNSRSDVLIEDVRILDNQKTSDITIAMVETDPGNVDFGVYFDQLSLRNASSGNTTLNIKLMDTGAAAVAATAATPLLNNPYDQFKLGVNGVLTTIQLDKVAVAAADTYEALLTVFQNALTGTGVTAALGESFTIVDPITTNSVTGKSIVLTGGAGTVINAPNGSGWYNTTGASVPPTSNIYTTYTQGSSSVTELVTSKVILDDVGRGSTGGDLVIGGLSTGDTSTSRGVERFEIEVRDNSKLQTINSTNNALREVVIVNGATSNAVANAYTTTVANEGDLTVNGDAAQALAGGSQSAGNAQLPGVENNSPAGIHHGVGAAGFVDVRLIDASAFKGKLAFTAAISTDSLAKYVNLADTQSNPAGDVAGSGNVNFNVKGANFIYTGGNDNDTMVVSIDSAVAASTTLTGQSDFTIVLSGAEGNDTITTNIGGNETNAWYVDQKKNANITIDGGAGNDRITTTGAGDVIINAGAGDDVVFADNSGVVGATWTVNAVGAAPDLADLQTNLAGNGFLYNGKLTVSFTGAGGVGLGGGVTAGAADSVSAYTNGFEKTVNIPTGTNYAVTQLHINQAIKDAINNDAVLKELLSATDGPADTLVIKSKIDGAFNANDLRVTISAADLTGLTTTEQSNVLTAYKAFAQNSAATIATAQAAAAATVVAANDVTGMDDTPVLAANGAISTAIGSDNKIDLGAGSDLVVLGTGANSNDTLVFTGYNLGKNTVVNFQDGAASNTDYLDFSSYLNNKTSASGSTASEKAIAVSLNGDAVVEANSVTVLKGVFTADQTFANLSETGLLAAVNSTNTGVANYAGITAVTLDAATSYITTAGANNLVGGIGKSIVLVENNGNEGHYKIFELTFNGLATNTTKDFTSAQLVGEVDFGNTVDFTVGLLNGTAAVAGVPPVVVPPAGAAIAVTAAGVAGTAAADVFSINAAAALADAAGTNFQPTITGFAVAADKLSIDLPTANAAITTLAQLNGQQGVSVQADPFTGNTLINLGNDANGGEVVTITLAGVADPATVVVEII